MSKLFKNIFYGLTFGLSVLIIIWILSSSRSSVGSPVSYGLMLMYVLFVIAIIVALTLAIKGLMHSPKSAIMFGIGIGVLILLIVIGYSLDSHNVTDSYKKYGVSSTTYSGIIGGSLIATWIVLGGAVLISLYASIADLIKKL